MAVCPSVLPPDSSLSSAYSTLELVWSVFSSLILGIWPCYMLSSLSCLSFISKSILIILRDSNPTSGTILFVCLYSFFCCCNPISEGNNVEEEGFSLAHPFRGLNPCSTSSSFLSYDKTEHCSRRVWWSESSVFSHWELKRQCIHSPRGSLFTLRADDRPC